MKYYMELGGDWVWPISEFADRELKEGEEIILDEMIRDFGGPMWCKEEGEFVDEPGICGRECENYKPCNGVSGKCRWLVNGFVATGKRFILTKNGLQPLAGGI